MSTETPPSRELSEDGGCCLVWLCVLLFSLILVLRLVGFGVWYSITTLGGPTRRSPQDQLHTEQREPPSQER